MRLYVDEKDVATLKEILERACENTSLTESTRKVCVKLVHRIDDYEDIMNQEER